MKDIQIQYETVKSTVGALKKEIANCLTQERNINQKFASQRLESEGAYIEGLMQQLAKEEQAIKDMGSLLNAVLDCVQAAADSAETADKSYGASVSR